MGVSSSQLQPQELITFKKLPISVKLDNIEIPEKSENRRPTNVKWLIIMGVFVFILLPFMIYTLYYSDIRRILGGYDKCGNLCGVQNYRYDGISCSGADFSNKPYLQYEDYSEKDFDSLFQNRYCVASCKSGFVPVLGRCLKGSKKSSIFEEDDSVTSYDLERQTVDIGQYLDDVKWQIIICCLLSVLVSMGMLFLFRFAVAFVVWGIMIGCFFGLVILVGVCWYFYVAVKNDPNLDQDSVKGLLLTAIFFTIFAVVLGIILIWCRKKIHLVILLLKETAKAIFTMPELIAVPVICLFAVLVLSLLFAVTSFCMSSAGNLEPIVSDYYVYNMNPVMIFTLAYNFVVFLWLCEFFTGIQYMTVAGAVAKWYFARDKTNLGSPILTSASNAFKFHLGSIALGSLIITIVTVIKNIILSVIKNEKIRSVVDTLAEAVETFFKFLSKNAYIITAMHGQAFLKSGKRAAKLIVQNIADVIAVNSIGDFVLGMAKFLIVVITILLSMGLFAMVPSNLPGASNLWAYVIIGIVAIIVASVAFGVFETTIDTIFICYCEDSLLNDGMARPYFMSRNLREFVEKSKEIYGKK